MGTRNHNLDNVTLDDCVITLNPDRVADIPSLEIDVDKCKKVLVKQIYSDFEYTGVLHWDPFMFYKFIGVYDWVLTYCPNKRVVHLAKYGKNDRVRFKNFWRAYMILGKICEKRLDR